MRGGQRPPLAGVHAARFDEGHAAPAQRASRVIVAANNFAGRTTTIVGFSSEAQYRSGFGPFAPGFVTVPYGDAAALEAGDPE